MTIFSISVLTFNINRALRKGKKKIIGILHKNSVQFFSKTYSSHVKGFFLEIIPIL